jgi:hypothetical protein
MNHEEVRINERHNRKNQAIERKKREYTAKAKYRKIIADD